MKKTPWLLSLILTLAACDDTGLSVAKKSNFIYTGPTLKMPIPPGYKWSVNTEAKSGYGGTVMGREFFDEWHTDAHNSAYAIDFGRHMKDNRGVGHSFVDNQVDILAAAAGKVVLITKSGCEQNMGWAKTCKIFIDHGNGYVTEYLHFSDNSSLSVNLGDQVVQGQFLGKMGTTGFSTGVHLHFQLLHEESGLESYAHDFSYTDPNDGSTHRYQLDSSSTNSALASAQLDGFEWPCEDHKDPSKYTCRYKVDTYHLSKNGFVYDTSPDLPETCSDEPSGGSDANGWTYTCSRTTTFDLAQQVWTNLRLNNLTKDICFKVEFYRGNDKKAETGEWCSDRIESDGGWDHAYMWGSFTPREAGTNWQARYFVRLKNGGAHYLSVAMAVAPNFTVNNTPIPIPSTPTIISPTTSGWPGVPMNSYGGSPLTFSWTNSAGAVNYNMLFFTWSGSDWVGWGPFNALANPVNVSGIPSNTDCAWAIAACNGSGCSGWSSFAVFHYTNP
jgi:hypothetical protein